MGDWGKFEGMLNHQVGVLHQADGESDASFKSRVVDMISVDELRAERDAARAEAARHKAELEKWCADAERVMDDVVLPKSKAIEEERDAARAEVERLKLRLASGIALVNAAMMGMKSAAPKLKAWAESKEDGA
jgi:hypothetical protein